MQRRSFLIASLGILFATRRLPTVDLGRAKRQAPYFLMPSYFEENSAACWLELQNGLWQPRMFEAQCERDRQAVAQYDSSLEKPGLSYEELAKAPRQPGRWTVRLRQSCQLYYLASTCLPDLLGDDVEYTSDPADAPVMTHANAVQLALELLRQAERPDVFSFYEPIPIEGAAYDYDENAGPLIVDYLPTGYQVE